MEILGISFMMVEKGAMIVGLPKCIIIIWDAMLNDALNVEVNLLHATVLMWNMLMAP